MIKDNYVPMSSLAHNKESVWVFTDINLSYEELAKKGIILWCHNNIKSKWTMLGGSKFGFESGEDAVIFKLQFST